MPLLVFQHEIAHPSDPNEVQGDLGDPQNSIPLRNRDAGSQLNPGASGENGWMIELVEGDEGNCTDPRSTHEMAVPQCGSKRDDPDQILGAQSAIKKIQAQDN